VTPVSPLRGHTAPPPAVVSSADAFGIIRRQSQRDCASKPRVASLRAILGGAAPAPPTPTGLRQRGHKPGRNSAGVEVHSRIVSQGSSCLATLGLGDGIPLGFALRPALRKCVSGAGRVWIWVRVGSRRTSFPSVVEPARRTGAGRPSCLLLLTPFPSPASHPCRSRPPGASLLPRSRRFLAAAPRSGVVFPA
jgi:hypothetical protein